MNQLRMAIALALFGSAWCRAAHAPPADPEPKPASGGGFIFSLLPKSFQKNPRLDFNIITEMTAAGRKVPVPTPQKPAYYVAESGGMHNEGLLGGEGNLRPPSEAQLRRIIEKALAESGYLPGSDAAHAPSLVIIYQYGAHGFTPPASLVDALPANVLPPPEDPAGTGDVPVPEIQVRKTLLDRAMLIGGAKFAKEVAFAMEQVDHKAALQRSSVAPEGGDFMGNPGDMLRDPFEELRSRSVEMERLVDELFSSSFFVVATAYDYAALAKGTRRVLWRTKLTVNSLGVNMSESLPPLIASGAQYFGRETTEPVVITKRISREGHVEIGTSVVVPDKPAELPKDAPAVAPKK